VGDENEAMEHATWNGTNYSGVLSFCSYNSDVNVSDQAIFFISQSFSPSTKASPSTVMSNFTFGLATLNNLILSIQEADTLL
jgi:hypothetical protein